jgi:acyl-CoA reductase-like NAD-dependent aldehyde dehydrogenase
VETVPVLIGGERRLAASGDTIDAVNPATGELIARIPRCVGEDIDNAVQAAKDAFPAWRATSAEERAALVLEFADAIERHAEQLAQLDVADNGSPIREMRNDSAVAVGALRYFAGIALQLRGETIPTEFDRLDYTLRQPFGVVGRIIPFNHPLMFAASKIAAPLVAGNTVVLKPSEHTSLSALRLADHLQRIFPRGVVNVVTGYGAETGDALVTHPDVRKLAFIGLEETGRRIQARAASVAVKHVTLELGGKNPIVVLPDADLDQAVDGAVRGMNFTWQGQSCGSTSRLIVLDGVHEEFVERLTDRVSRLRSGLPWLDETQTGSMVNQAQFDKVMRYVALGQEEGARLRTGGDHVRQDQLENGLFVSPALFDGVSPDMRLAQEEIFGPVLAILPARDYDDALRIANGVRFGLTASIFTRDLALAHRFARDVEAGYVWVNDSSRHFAGAPFGGFKDSGVGREEDIEELLSYTQIKNVNVRFG